MGDEAGPAEREVASLRFQQLCRLKIFEETPETLTPPERYQLIAVSNKYGFTFVGSDSGVKIFQTTELGRLHELHRDSTGAVVTDYECVKLSLGTRPLHVSLNNTELILSVCYQQGNNLVLNFYDVRIVTKKNTSPTPFMTSVLSQTPEVRLVDLAWNPGFEPLLVTCLSDGNCTIWDSSDKVLKPIARLPADVGVTAVCWSPKGKQVVVGTAQGELKQFNHASELKKVVKSPDFTQEAVKVVDIHWLSTYMFIVAYIDAEESLQPNIVVVHAPKEKPVSYINFEDICFGSCEERTACYYIHYLDKWQFAITCSSNSMDGAVLGRQQQNKDLWEIWTLDDAARIEVPLCDHEETMPIGMAIDYTSEMNVKIKQHTLPPAPILMVLSSEGLLCPFYVINLEDAEGITKKPNPLPTGGERIGTGSAAQIQSAAASKPQTSFSQPSATPSPFSAPTAATAKPFSAAPAQPASSASITAAQPSVFGGFSGAASSGSSAGFQFKLPTATTASTPAVGFPATSTPMFGGNKSSPFGSAGFSFNASQTSTPTSSAAPITQTSAAKGFSFSAPQSSTPISSAAATQSAAAKAFSFAPPSQSAQAFNFKAVGSTPSSLPGASSTNAFVALSKPVTTTPTPAPSAQTMMSSVKTSLTLQPGGVPNAAVPSGLGGVGQQGLFGKGPPNAVAPGAASVPTSVVSGASSSQSAQPGGGLTAATPAGAVVPQGSAAKVATPQPAQAVPSLSVAPTSIAAVAPTKPASAVPNAVAPSQGLPPSYPEAKASKDAPDSQRPQIGKPVAVVQQTPKASGDSIKPVGISATSTPAASAKPVTAALLSNIKEEMEHFNKELTELKTRAAAGRDSVGSTKDLQDICKGVDDLASFKEEVLECTKSLNEDIHGLKSKLLNSFSLVEESRLRKQRSKDPRYLQLLRSRGLDPQSAKQMQEIRSLYHYLETGIRDTNTCLDMEWEKVTHGKGMGSSKRMVTPTMDTIYQTIGNHVNILTTQKNKLIDLRKQLITAQRYDVTSSFNILPSSKIKPSSDPSSLASRLAEVKVSSQPKARGTPMSAKKQAILRDVLSQRQTTPIRSAPRAARASSSSVSSPPELDDFPLPPERRLRFPSDESPPKTGSQMDGSRPAHHAGRADLRGIGAVTSAQAAKPAPVVSQLAPRPTPPQSTPTPSHSVPTPVTRSTQTPSQPPSSQRSSGPPPQGASLHSTSTPAKPSAASTMPIHLSGGMVTSTPLPQGAQGAGQTTPKGQAPPPMTSSFSHTGSGTVAWGMTGASAKPTSPGQQAGAAALNRSQSVKAGNKPVEKPSPPVVNIKNLDTMKGTMPPPVTFAPVASSVDAGTAKVVTQVIAEMAIASGVKTPQPGTVASASGDSLPVSPSGQRPAPMTTTTTTQAASSSVVMTPASLSAKPLASTIAASSSVSAVKPMSQPISSASGVSKIAAAKETTPSFSFSKPPSVSTIGSKGFSFGDRSSLPPASRLSTGFNFGAKAPATSSAVSAEPSVKGDTTSPVSDTGVKPQIFDFSGAATKPKANVSTPGGYFFGAPSGSASIGATPASGATSSKAQVASAQVTLPAQPAASDSKEKEAKGKDESGTGKPTAATTKPSQATDEAGSGTKPPSVFGSSSLLGAMLDKPVVRSQPSAPVDENTKLQQSTKSILSGVTFPTGGSTSAGATQSSTASPGPAARNLFGTTPSSAPGQTATAPSTTSSAFGGSSLFASIASMSKGAEASTSASAPVATSPAAMPLFGKTTSTGSPFGAQPTSSGASSGAGATSTTSAAGFGLFGQPAGAASSAPSLFGKPSTASSSASSTASAPVFGQTPSLFGQAAGSSTATSSGGPFSSGGFSFGAKPGLGPGGEGSASKSLFGSSQTAGSLSFAQLASGSGTPSSEASGAGGGGPFGGGGSSSGGFFSGLGGKPDPEAAKKNPFGLPSTQSSGFGQASSGTSIFGSSSAKAFGAQSTTPAAPAFGSPSSSNAFGSSPGVANTGFGGFGQAPAFGQTKTASPAFGSPGSGAGGGLGFGTGATFSNPLGQSPFGSPQQSSSASVFGASSSAASTGGGFGTFASQNAPSFGALAGSGGGGGGFGQQQQSTGFGAFGGGGNNTGGFGGFGQTGSNNAFGGASSTSSSGFSGGSSFTQYRH